MLGRWVLPRAIEGCQIGGLGTYGWAQPLVIKYVSGIFLDFDNVYGSLFRKSKDAAYEFATDPAKWLNAFKGMRANEPEDTDHNFVIRRCYLNPSGWIPGGKQPFSASGKTLFAMAGRSSTRRR